MTLRVSTIAVTMTLMVSAAMAEPQPGIEDVAQIQGAMPTGITIAPNGRIFLNYPQWGDKPPFAVGELKDGKVRAYPDTSINTPNSSRPAETFLSVQSVVADAKNRLWVLDTASPGFKVPAPGGAKLVAVDLGTDKVVKTIILGPDVVLPTTYLNDVRFDLRQGISGVAYITDSSISGFGGLIVVDLDSGKAMRRLSGHPSTMPDLDFITMMDGRPMMSRPADGQPTPFVVASDGIAISADGEMLYYCALSSRHFYAVPTALLRDPRATDEEIALQIRDLGAKGPSDGLAEDDRGRIYAGDYEQNSIRRYADGRWTTIASDPRILWPDTLSVGTDRYLYFTANQLHRQPGFNKGRDLRQQPYHVYRVRIDAGPVQLK